MQRTRETLVLLLVNLLYLVILLGLLFIPMVIPLFGIRTESTVSQLIQMILLEIVIVGIPALIAMIALRRIRREKTAPIMGRPLPFMNIVLVGGMAATGYGFIIFVNLVWSAILSLIGEPAAQEIPSITTGNEFLLAVVALGVVPALCEELLFRGVMLTVYGRRLKWVTAVILVGVLFAAYHILLMTIPSIIILGVMITYVVYRTRSVWAGVIYHFVHNFLSVCLAYVQPKLMEYMEGQGITADMYELEGSAMLSGIIAWGVIGAVCLAFFGVFTWLLHFRTRDIIRPAASLEKTSVIEWLPVILAGVLILYFWIVQIIQMAAG